MRRFNPKPVVLTGRHVRLEPLQPAHAAGLYAIGRDPEIHRYLIGPAPASAAAMAATVTKALAAAATGLEVPFAIIHLPSAKVAGTTRFFEIRRKDRVLEIGHTWLGTAFQRTAANTEAKYLLLRHAFEQLGAVRVQLKTDERNERSRRAIERLGARLEGILHNYQTRWDGFVRNTAMYAIVAAEWPAVKAGLMALLDGS